MLSEQHLEATERQYVTHTAGAGVADAAAGPVQAWHCPDEDAAKITFASASAI